MNYQVLGFLCGGAVLFYEHLKVQLPYFRTKRRYIATLHLRRIPFGTADDLKLQLLLRSNPEQIYSDGDDQEMRLLKQELVSGRNRIYKSFPKLLVLLFIAPLGGLILFSLIEFGLKHAFAK